MLLTALSTLTMAFQAAGNPAQTVNPGELVSRMLAYYNDAETLTGTIVMLVKDNAGSVAVTTQIQYEKPNKLYIKQQKSTGDRRTWLVVSNGKHFSYNVPQNLENDNPNRRLVEAVKVGDVTLTLRDIYAASAHGLADRSAALDIAISRTEDLRFLRDQWRTVEYKGQIEYDGVQVHVVSGQWRAYGTAPVQGQYRMYITDSGELRQFARSETMGDGTGVAIPLLSTWDVKLVKNGKPDEKLFEKVR